MTHHRDRWFGCPLAALGFRRPERLEGQVAQVTLCG
jgi:hypothetical protein